MVKTTNTIQTLQHSKADNWFGVQIFPNRAFSREHIPYWRHHKKQPLKGKPAPGIPTQGIYREAEHAATPMQRKKTLKASFFSTISTIDADKPPDQQNFSKVDKKSKFKNSNELRTSRLCHNSILLQSTFLASTTWANNKLVETENYQMHLSFLHCKCILGSSLQDIDIYQPSFSKEVWWKPQFKNCLPIANSPTANMTSKTLRKSLTNTAKQSMQ